MFLCKESAIGSISLQWACASCFVISSEQDSATFSRRKQRLSKMFGTLAGSSAHLSEGVSLSKPLAAEGSYSVGGETGHGQRCSEPAPMNPLL